MEKSLKFKVDGISEEELELLLSLSKEEVKNILENRINNSTNNVLGGGCRCRQQRPPLKSVKTELLYLKEYSLSLLNKNVLGILFIINNKGYTYINDLMKIKNIKWDIHIKKLKKLEIIKNTYLPRTAQQYLTSKNGLTDHHINRMKCYALSENGIKILNTEMIEYINENIEWAFVNFISEQKEEYEFLDKQLKLEDMPDFIRIYLKNKDSWNKERIQQGKDMILKNEYLKKYCEENNIIL